MKLEDVQIRKSTELESLCYSFLKAVSKFGLCTSLMDRFVMTAEATDENLRKWLK